VPAAKPLNPHPLFSLSSSRKQLRHLMMRAKNSCTSVRCASHYSLLHVVVRAIFPCTTFQCEPPRNATISVASHRNMHLTSLRARRKCTVNACEPLRIAPSDVALQARSKCLKYICEPALDAPLTPASQNLLHQHTLRAVYGCTKNYCELNHIASTFIAGREANQHCFKLACEPRKIASMQNASRAWMPQ